MPSASSPARRGAQKLEKRSDDPHLLIGVAERVDGDAGREIEVLAVLRVVDDAALAVREDERRAGVRREEALGLLLEERRDVGRGRVVRVRRLQVGLAGLSGQQGKTYRRQQELLAAPKDGRLGVAFGGGQAGRQAGGELTSSDAKRTERAAATRLGAARTAEVAERSILAGREGGGRGVVGGRRAAELAGSSRDGRASLPP